MLLYFKKLSLYYYMKTCELGCTNISSLSNKSSPLVIMCMLIAMIKILFLM